MGTKAQVRGGGGEGSNMAPREEQWAYLRTPVQGGQHSRLTGGAAGHPASSWGAELAPREANEVAKVESDTDQGTEGWMACETE